MRILIRDECSPGHNTVGYVKNDTPMPSIYDAQSKVYSRYAKTASSHAECHDLLDIFETNINYQTLNAPHALLKTQSV